LSKPIGTNSSKARSSRSDGKKAVTAALLHIMDSPRAGALSSFQHAELKNVRRVLIPGFPKHLIFYQLRKSEILILRIIHGARDLESLF
jgi:toxin ParE1/3/4